MPVIRIKYDDTKVVEEDIMRLSSATQKIVAEVTEIEDVFVYADSPKIKINVAPIEIFVEISAQKVENIDTLLEKIRERLASWKSETNFPQPINLTVSAMPWKFVIGI